MLTIELCWGSRKTDSLTTKSAGSDGRSAKFDDYYNFLQFAGPEDLLQFTFFWAAEFGLKF